MVIGVGHNRLARHFIKGDVLRRQLCRDGDDHGMSDAFRIVDGPLHCLHSAETAAKHDGETLDAQRIGEQRLAFYPVAHCHNRKVRAVRFVGGRVGTGGAGRAETTAEVVAADNEPLIAIDRFAGADELFPPTRFFVGGVVIAGDVVAATQGVTNQNGIRFIGIQLPVSFVHQFIARQNAAARQPERLRKSERARLDEAYRVGRKFLGVSAGVGQFMN